MNRRTSATCFASGPEEALLDSLHSLSQPLTAISLALSLMECRIDESERAQLLTSAQAECRRAVDLMGELRLLVTRCCGELPKSQQELTKASGRGLGRGTERKTAPLSSTAIVHRTEVA